MIKSSQIHFVGATKPPSNERIAELLNISEKDVKPTAIKGTRVSVAVEKKGTDNTKPA